MNLTDGVLRMRYRDSQEKPELMNPDQVYKISVDLWATSNVFKKGHIIRLEVSSSNFPRFDRNLNTGADQATGREFVSATNTILHDAEHPSALLLPVIPAGAPHHDKWAAAGNAAFTKYPRAGWIDLSGILQALDLALAG